MRGPQRFPGTIPGNLWGAPATHLRLGDAALGAQGRHQGIDLAGGDATDVGLHDHRVQSLIDAAAGLEDRGQEAAGAQFGDLQREIAHLGGQGTGPVAVAVAETLLGALVPIGTEEGGKLQLDQPLQAMACQLRDQLTGAAAIEERGQLRCGSMGLGRVSRIGR